MHTVPRFLRLLGWMWMAALLFALSPTLAEELKPETARAWDAYVAAAKAHMVRRASDSGQFLWTDERPDRGLRLRNGEILAEPASGQTFERVPSGLIHHWIGAVYLPGATLADVMTVVRGYSRYNQIYKPSVVQSRTIATAPDQDRYSVLFLNRELISTMALETEYVSDYKEPDPLRCYSVTYSNRVQEIHKYGEAGQRMLPEGQGSGYIWRVTTFTRFEQRDNGVYMEVEAMVLSRDIPSSLRWAVGPMVRRLARNALLISLRQTRDAVRSIQMGHPTLEAAEAAANNASEGHVSRPQQAIRPPLSASPTPLIHR